MADQIVVAAAEGDYEVFGALIREYWAGCVPATAISRGSSRLWAATRGWMPS